MEMLCFGTLIGALFAIMLLMLGVIYDRIFEGKHDRGSGGSDSGVGDPDMDCPSDRDNNGRINCGHHMETYASEVINGLQNVRMSCSRQEKEYLDYAVECIMRVERVNSYIEGGCHAEESGHGRTDN